MPFAAGGRTLLRLSVALRQQRGPGQWHQRQGPYAGPGFDWPPDELPADAYERRPDAEVLGLEVDVLPAQRGDFAAAHAADHSQGEKGVRGRNCIGPPAPAAFSPEVEDVVVQRRGTGRGEGLEPIGDPHRVAVVRQSLAT